MLDSASSDQAKVNEEQLPIYRRQIAASDDMVGTNTWLFMHHPIYGLRSGSPGNDQPATNLTLDAAAQGQFPDGVQGIFGATSTFCCTEFRPLGNRHQLPNPVDYWP